MAPPPPGRVVRGADGVSRCFWCEGDAPYRAYHDTEWGYPQRDLWSFEPAPEARPERCTWDVLVKMPQTAESRALSKDLKHRGWTFVGPTTMYAFMQAVGIVNDHLEGCDARPIAERARSAKPRARPATE